MAAQTGSFPSQVITYDDGSKSIFYSMGGPPVYIPPPNETPEAKANRERLSAIPQFIPSGNMSTSYSEGSAPGPEMVLNPEWQNNYINQRKVVSVAPGDPVGYYSPDTDSALDKAMQVVIPAGIAIMGGGALAGGLGAGASGWATGAGESLGGGLGSAFGLTEGAGMLGGGLGSALDLGSLGADSLSPLEAAAAAPEVGSTFGGAAGEGFGGALPEVAAEIPSNSLYSLVQNPTTTGLGGSSPMMSGPANPSGWAKLADALGIPPGVREGLGMAKDLAFSPLGKVTLSALMTAGRQSANKNLVNETNRQAALAAAARRQAFDAGPGAPISTAGRGDYVPLPASQALTYGQLGSGHPGEHRFWQEPVRAAMGGPFSSLVAQRPGMAQGVPGPATGAFPWGSPHRFMDDARGMPPQGVPGSLGEPRGMGWGNDMRVGPSPGIPGTGMAPWHHPAPAMPWGRPALSGMSPWGHPRMFAEGGSASDRPTWEGHALPDPSTSNRIATAAAMLGLSPLALVQALMGTQEQADVIKGDYNDMSKAAFGLPFSNRWPRGYINLKADGGMIGDEEEPTGPLGQLAEGEGGGGQDDDVPALLSDGEFVIPADVVSDLGDGSNERGAALLQQMLENVRAHKGRPDGLPPKAMPPMEYMGEEG